MTQIYVWRPMAQTLWLETCVQGLFFFKCKDIYILAISPLIVTYHSLKSISWPGEPEDKNRIRHWNFTTEDERGKCTFWAVGHGSAGRLG